MDRLRGLVKPELKASHLDLGLWLKLGMIPVPQIRKELGCCFFLTRIQVGRVRVVEIGFRSTSASPDTEPAAYEWNVQHRSGRFQRKPEEALMLSGDQNMVELNATVHYSLARPDDFLMPAGPRRSFRR